MDRRTTEGALLIRLGGLWIEYRFARRRRRTIGITVDASGLSVSAPLRAPWREIESFLRQKERWIVAKLDEWARLPPAPVVRVESGESLPLFGAAVKLEVRTGRRAVHREREQLFVSAPSRQRVAKVLVSWLKVQALGSLAPRAAHYAAHLSLGAPPVALSNARTQWGICTEGGAIRLSWRLVHLEPELADYVVAHEVAHLIELNHSKRFWNLLARLYPEWREARARLELAGASLPIIAARPEVNQ